MSKPGKKTNMTQLQKLAKNSVTNKHKIDSPIAKYDSLERLWCKICNTIIKSELLWPSHIAGKVHKESLNRIKTSQPVVNETILQKPPNEIQTFKESNEIKPKSILKRKVDESCYILPSKILAVTSENDLPHSQPQIQSDERLRPQKSSNELDNVTSKNIPSSLPPGFFEIPISNSNSESFTDVVIGHESVGTDDNEKSGKDETNQESQTKLNKDSDAATVRTQIPKGFFDNPEIDAKVRGDKKPQVVFEEEWESFQKLVVQEETKISEEMQEEEEEITNYAREIEEIDEQIIKWSNIENIHILKETKMQATKLKANRLSNMEMENQSSDELEEEELAVLEEGWRLKKV